MTIHDYKFSLVFLENQLNSAILGLLDIGDMIDIQSIGDVGHVVDIRYIKGKRDIPDIPDIGWMHPMYTGRPYPHPHTLRVHRTYSVCISYICHSWV